MPPLDEPHVDLSPKVSDEIRRTTCYMCACRCGIDVHMRDGMVRYIEGNKNHPVNKGVLCAKGSAGIMQHYSPARLMKPLKRVGPRGSGEFEEISWDEALTLAADRLGKIRADDPKKLAFFTGRDQSQSFTSWWAQMFGTPNYAAHGGFCSVNMAAAGIYTMGGAFWEFGSPDWERTKMFMIFGVAEDHDSNPIKLGLSRLKERGAKIVGVNPVRTGYNAIADEWVGVTPGTDALFILSLVHELVRTGNVDLDYMLRYTNSPWLVVQNPGKADDGMFARGEDGEPLIWSRKFGDARPAKENRLDASMKGEFQLPDGRMVKPVFHILAEKYLDAQYTPDAVAERTGVAAKTIKRLAAEIAKTAFEEAIELDTPWTDVYGERHAKMIGRPVSFHAMRGISAHSNGFQTCRAIHVLQLLLGSVEVPGGFRFKPPYPKPMEGHPPPHTGLTDAGTLDGPHLGYPRGPESLQINEDGSPRRIDKAFTWDAPMSAHGLMHMVISNAHAGDPYKIDTLFMYMANMSWNSSMNTRGVMEMLESKEPDGEYTIPYIIYSDAYSSEMVAYADLVLPDTTYLERHDCISLLDRPICEAEAAADAIRWPVVDPKTQGYGRDVKGFQSALCDLGARLKLPNFVTDDGSQKFADYADYIVNHERRPGVGPLAGWRGEDGESEGRGAPNKKQIDKYIENGGFWVGHIPDDAMFYKFANQGYQDWAVKIGLFDKPAPYTMQIYVETLQKFRNAAKGHGDRIPPAHLRDRIVQTFDPLPIWYKPFEQEGVDENEYPLHALTQRPAAMYHSWGSQNAWLRQIHGRNPLYVPGEVCDYYDLKDGDWAHVSSHHGRITVPVARMDAVNPKTLWTWNAIGKRKGAWALSDGAPEVTKGFLLNHLIHELLPPKGDGLRWANSDPITGQAAWYDLRVKIEKADPPADAEAQPDMNKQKSPVAKAPDEVRYGEEWT